MWISPGAGTHRPVYKLVPPSFSAQKRSALMICRPPPFLSIPKYIYRFIFGYLDIDASKGIFQVFDI
uniref:Uncharacterized protein n=1 Tax=Steinernema glaseri TaxID=37863 RepID=A0A1I7YLP4_9BILA